MQFKSIGKIIKTHGLDGRLFIIVKKLNNEFVCSLKYLFFGNRETDPDDVLHLKEIRPFKNGYLVRIEGINHISDAEKLLRSFLFLEEKDLPQIKSKEMELVGYEVENSIDNSIVGTISTILNYPAQDILVVKNDTMQEFMIPFVDAFVKEINHEKKLIRVETMEGLLDAD